MVFDLVKQKHSVARAINQTNVEYPLLYQLRQCIDQGNRITDAIRTNISFLKSEKLTLIIKYKYGIKDYKRG
jgi:hypothetical protein